MPDIAALLSQFWHRYLKPFAKRLSFRVTQRGSRLILAWAILIIVYNLLALLPLVGITDGLLAIIVQGLQGLSLVVSTLLLVAVMIDYFLLLKATTKNGLAHGLKINRQTQRNLSVQSWSTVTLSLYHPTPANVQLTLIDQYPLIAESQDLPVTIHARQLSQLSQAKHDNLTSDSNTIAQGCDIKYALYPTQRGIADFSGVDLIVQSAIGLLSKYIHMPETQITGTHQVRVLANFADLIQGNLLGVTQKSALSGILKQRRKGQGQDFHQIRNYTEGDSIRHLDWKATSRYQRLMTREYQDERDQQILFLLDCGQHMRHIRFFDEGLNISNPTKPHQPVGSHLDQALNAMLLLAEVANEQGDATGFITFASQNDKIMPPKKGQQVISYLLNQSFDIQPSMLSPDYIAAAKTTRQVQKRRSLLILITNTRQEDHSELTEALKLLSAKHIVILANLYEQDMYDYLASLPVTTDEALTYHTVQEYLHMREKLHRSLSEQTHIYSISCTPKALPAKLINQYLAIKQKHRL